MKIFGIFIIIFDLIINLDIGNYYGKIKHQILVQSWWRAVIMVLIAGFIGALYNIYLAFSLIFIVVLLLNRYQEIYAKERRKWDNYDANEHLILSTFMGVLMLALAYVVTIKTGIPKYKVIKEITLTDKTVTNNSTVYLDINSKLIELATGRGCTMGDKVLIYRENSNGFINTDFYSDYYLDCYKSMKKITKI
jgi:large-conductance mechanosensitive channel